MPEYLQQEANTDRILTEDGSGAFLLETSSVLATLSGGGSAYTETGRKNARATASVTGGGATTASGVANETGAGVLTGGGAAYTAAGYKNAVASPTLTTAGSESGAGQKDTSATLTLTAGGTLTATGTASTTPVTHGLTGQLGGVPTRKHVRYRVPIQRFANVYLTGGGRLSARATKHTTHAVALSGSGTLDASGTKTITATTRLVLRGGVHATATRTAFTAVRVTTTGTQTATRTTDAFEMELRQLLEDALVLSET